MNRFFLFLLASIFPVTGAFAQTQDANRKLMIELCGANFAQNKTGAGMTVGQWVKKGSNYCVDVACEEVEDDNNKSSVKRNKCLTEDQYNKWVLGAIDNPNGTTAGATTTGVTSGATTTGVTAGATTTGVTAGATTTGVTAGATTSGATTAGTDSGSGPGDDGVGPNGRLQCVELDCDPKTDPDCGIEIGGLCYNECRPKRAVLGILGRHKEGFERASCVKCLLKYPNKFKLKKEFLPKDKHGRVKGDKSINPEKFGGALKIKTGVYKCPDGKGGFIYTSDPSVYGSHAGCIHGAGGVPAGAGSGVAAGAGGGVAAGAGGGRGGAVVVVNGGGSGAGDVQLPDFCTDSKKYKAKKCREWMEANARWRCTSGQDAQACIGAEAWARIEAKNSSSGVDCVNGNCGASRRATRGGSSFLDIATGTSMILGALAPVGVAAFQANAQIKTERAWASAAEKGFEQCRLSQQDFTTYLAANQLPGLTPEERAAQNCNGYQLDRYAGLHGANGGLANYYSAGYTPGFINGYVGPYGAAGGVPNPYLGIYGNGANIYQNGAMYPYGGVNPNAGVYANGVLPNGGILPNGGAGVYLNAGGLLPNINIGGAGQCACVTAPCNCGGYYQPGGYASGTGQYAPPYYNGNGSYWNNTQVNGQFDYANTVQASNYDRYLQQQGAVYQMNANGNYSPNYIYNNGASFGPNNLGIRGGGGVNLQFGFNG